MTVPHSKHRRFAILLALLVSALGLTVSAAPAGAAGTSACAKKVVADWYGDGRVDRVYPLHCYTDAIRSLPVDVLDYSNAKEDILRALSFAKRGKPDPGDAGTGSGTGSSGGSGGGSSGSGGSGGGSSGGSPSEQAGGATGGRPVTEPDETAEQTLADADPVDTSGPSSVPVPLLVLGGLALLLLAAGAAGYLSRRSQARKGAGGPGDPAT